MDTNRRYRTLTILERLLLKYPNEDWNWFYISENANITMDFVQDHPEKPWKLHRYSDPVQK